MNQTISGNNKYIMYYAAFCTALYGILAVVFLNTNYVEGDDASTVLYHLMGRDKNVQMPYSAYHSGFDFILSFISPNEVILRSFATIVSFIFGGLVLYLSGVLLFKLEMLNSKTLFYYLLLLPFIIPEFIFNSGLYNPTNIGFTFILLSTLSLLKYIQYNQVKYLVVFAVLFAIGIPFRWSLVFFLPVYLAIFILKSSYKPQIKQLLIFAAFSLLGICLALCAIAITGYTPKDMVETYLWGKGYMEKAETSILSLAANAISYYTIPFVLCLLLGAYSLVKNKAISNKFWLLLLLCISPYFIISFHTSFKYSITYMPMLLLLGYWGFETIKAQLYLTTLFWISIILIWFVGIQFDSNKMAYGPGFSNKIVKYEEKTINNNPDNRINAGNVYVALNGGLLMPTPEGPRPLMGFFYLIFSGQWRAYIEEQAKDRMDCIQLVINEDITLFQDRKTAYLQCDLYRLGYEAKEFQSNGNYFYRTFVNNANHDTIQLNVIPNGVDKVEWMLVNQNQKPVILRASYSNLISEIGSKDEHCRILNIYTVLMK